MYERLEALQEVEEEVEGLSFRNLALAAEEVEGAETRPSSSQVGLQSRAMVMVTKILL